MKIASFFSGCGGLDKGFTNVGFKLAFANDNWLGCKETFELNHNIGLCTKSITEISPKEVPDVVGFVGGPPCQSWSLAGAMRGVNDPRGQVMYDYIRLLKVKKPKFFLVENVAGILSKTHIGEFNNILEKFEDAGYTITHALLNAKDFGVPQERKRVFVVGYRKDLGKKYVFPEPTGKIVPLQEAIGNLPEPMPAKEMNKSYGANLPILNHEYMNGSFSTIYMSRNRKKGWDEPSFTIQAGGRHAPLHPSASPMIKLGKDDWKFDETSEAKYRRLSVRECARVQTFPDDFVFKYISISDGYKMIGNAVPVRLAEELARRIYADMEGQPC